MSWTRQYWSMTEVLGSLPMRQVPGLVLAAAEALAGHLLQVWMAPASLSQASALAAMYAATSSVCGWRSPERRATGMPQ